MTPAPAGRAFDAVLCDLDNVIRFYDTAPLAALERAAGLPEGTTTDLGYAPETDLPLLLGRITPEAWVESIAAERAGVPVERCLFVDDRQENIDAAAALGMTTVLYREPDDLRRALGACAEEAAGDRHQDWPADHRPALTAALLAD
ncbi:HAD-IA family hydrolase [Streptomyces rubiginosohelvolus]|uniref:HAD-IA family hydrolase n=1 Tax=Streptomyces rubiginosohelvolus TaxID=67362 RepID=UPI00364C86EB